MAHKNNELIINASKAWIHAFRPRTLPLALACVALGSFLAAYDGKFSVPVLIFSMSTTLFLQILSNLSNDYGDSVHGADFAGRTGPRRAVQSGIISKKEMKKAIVLFAILSLVSGLTLLVFSFESFNNTFFLLLMMGIAAIWAAINYTAGHKPYGYAGFGDLFVVVFFGLIGVMGTYFLHTKTIQYDYFLPALSCGLLATAVLNINNIRDIESDKTAGKKSIPVRIGKHNALIYHWFLLIAALLSAVVFVLLHYQSPFQFLFLLAVPLIFKNGIGISKAKTPGEIDPYLKQLAVTTLFFILTFGMGLLI